VRGLGLVQGEVSKLEDLTGITGVLIGGDADTGARGEALPVNFHRLGQLAENTACERLHPRDGCGLLDQQGELVAAEPGCGVPRPNGRRKDFGDTPEHLVSDGVPSGVVDQLELVEIDEQHDDLRAQTGSPIQRVVESIREQTTVGQSSERHRERRGA